MKTSQSPLLPPDAEIYCDRYYGRGGKGVIVQKRDKDSGIGR